MADIRQFRKIADTVTSLGWGNRTRVYYSIRGDQPVAAGLLKRGAVFGPEFYAENAHLVHTFEEAIIGCGAREENKRVALWYLSKFHQGSCPVFVRDLATVFQILSASEARLAQYIFVQSLADIISQDLPFIYLIKKADPGKKAKLGAGLSGFVRHESRFKDDQLIQVG